MNSMARAILTIQNTKFKGEYLVYSTNKQALAMLMNTLNKSTYFEVPNALSLLYIIPSQKSASKHKLLINIFSRINQ